MKLLTSNQQVTGGNVLSQNQKNQRGASRLLLLVAMIVVLAIVVGALGWSLSNSKNNEDKTINTKEFQALFLTNGQVYFGKLSNLNDKYVTLTDIYYLQVQQGQSLQQGTSSDVNSNSKVSLAKLGNELHGPEDKMQVSSQQVLFWENLKSSSKVVQAIDKYQSQ